MADNDDMVADALGAVQREAEETAGALCDCPDYFHIRQALLRNADLQGQGRVWDILRAASARSMAYSTRFRRASHSSGGGEVHIEKLLETS